MLAELFLQVIAMYSLYTAQLTSCMYEAKNVT